MDYQDIRPSSNEESVRLTRLDPSLSYDEPVDLLSGPHTSSDVNGLVLVELGTTPEELKDETIQDATNGSAA